MVGMGYKYHYIHDTYILYIHSYIHTHTYTYTTILEAPEIRTTFFSHFFFVKKSKKNLFKTFPLPTQYHGPVQACEDSRRCETITCKNCNKVCL